MAKEEVDALLEGDHSEKASEWMEERVEKVSHLSVCTSMHIPTMYPFMPLMQAVERVFQREASDTMHTAHCMHTR